MAEETGPLGLPEKSPPYKFHGLPGLIVELYDDKNNYKFELVQSVKIADLRKTSLLKCHDR